MTYKINFNEPTQNALSYKYVVDAIHANHTSGDGPYTRRCSQILEEEFGVKKVLLTTSGTHALELTALLMDPLFAIVPSFTFTSTANSFAMFGAQVILTDITENTLNIDTEQAIAEIRPQSVIVPVHYAGVGCDMDSIMTEYVQNDELCGVVEDNAQGLFGKRDGRYLGTFSPLAAVSFHETKNLTMGEGGALFINDESFVEKAEILREKGTNRTKFKRGEVDKYSWVDIGSSYLPSDILAAYLCAQLEEWRNLQHHRQVIWNRYWAALNYWADENGIRVPFVPDNCEQPYHLFYLIMPNKDTRDRFIREMKDAGIMAVFHYIPLHLSPMGEELGYRKGQFPVSERISDCLVRLPFYTSMNPWDQEYVIEKVRAFKS